jgi:tetratricopeptide (TPR) repeat protein
MQYYILLIIWGLFHGHVFAHKHSNIKFETDFDSKYCSKIQHSISEFELDEAKKYVDIEYKLNPKNQAVVLLQNYIYFLEIFTSEDKELYNKYKPKEKQLLEQINNESYKSPYKLWMYAEIKIHWALLKIKMGDNTSAALAVKEAHSKLKQNQKAYPNFVANKKLLGWIEMLMGSMPDSYAWMLKLASMDNDFDRGEKLILDFCEHSDTLLPDFLIHEANFALMQVYIQVSNQKEKAKERIDKFYSKKNNSILTDYMLAISLYGINENELLIKKLSEIKTKQTEKTIDLPFLEFLHGISKARKIDFSAIQHFSNFIQIFKGSNNIKAAYFYNALLCHMQGNLNKSLQYKEKAKKIGAQIQDSDKQAMKECSRVFSDNISLHKTRLLFDGMYLSKALEEATIALKNSKTEIDKIESVYRLGRVYHAQKQYSNAIEKYKQCMEIGKESERFFAANSALLLGNIYEEKADKINARKYYNMALKDFPNNKEYTNSIESKSKSALNRLKK